MHLKQCKYIFFYNLRLFPPKKIFFRERELVFETESAGEFFSQRVVSSVP